MELRDAIMDIISKNLHRRTEVLDTLNHSGSSLDVHGKKGHHLLKTFLKLMGQVGGKSKQGKFWANKGRR